MRAEMITANRLGFKSVAEMWEELGTNEVHWWIALGVTQGWFNGGQSP